EAANANGWHRNAVTVTLAAADDAGGWGVSSITYALTGAQTADATLPAAGGSVAISAEGITTLTYFATDTAGNAEAPHTLVVSIDSTPPVFDALPSFSVDATSLAGATVAFSATASDNSGLAPTILCTPASGSSLPIGQNPVACV